MEEKIINELKKSLDKSKVKTRDNNGFTLSYVEGWYVIAEANRIFGNGGWTRETVSLQENCAPTQNQKGNFIVSFRAKVKVTAHGVIREGVGFGSGIAKDIHAAYEGAIKEAETDAMKRALMTFGYPLGLALYDKTMENVEVKIDTINEVQLATLQNMMMEVQADETAFLKYYGIEKLEDLPSASFLNAKSGLEKKRAQQLLEKHNDTDTEILAAG